MTENTICYTLLEYYKSEGFKNCRIESGALLMGVFLVVELHREGFATSRVIYPARYFTKSFCHNFSFKLIWLRHEKM